MAACLHQDCPSVQSATVPCATSNLLDQRLSSPFEPRYVLTPWLLAPQVMLNPFFTPTTKITSPLFHQRVRQLARNYFR